MIYICLAFIIIGILGYFFDSKYDIDLIEYLSNVIFFVGVVSLIISIMFIILCNSGSNGKYQQKIEEYNYLMNRIDSDEDISKTFLKEEIYEWNKDIVYNKVNQRSFILGPFIPNIYDNLQTIDYNIVFQEKKNTYNNDFINVKTILR